VVHDFPADGEYIFKVGFYYSPTGPLFGLNQGTGQQIEISVNGERVALLDINPAMKLANDGIKPSSLGEAGRRRISASSLKIRRPMTMSTGWWSRAWSTSAREPFRG